MNNRLTAPGRHCAGDNRVLPEGRDREVRSSALIQALSCDDDPSILELSYIHFVDGEEAILIRNNNLNTSPFFHAINSASLVREVLLMVS